MGGWGVSSATESIKEASESVSKSSFFGFGGGGGGGGGSSSFSMSNSVSKKVGTLSNTWGVNSLFGGGAKNDIELDPISTLTGEGADADALGNNLLEAPAEGGGAGEFEAAVHPPVKEATETAPEVEPTPTGWGEQPSTTEQSTTENPTDAAAEEGEQDDGFTSSKKGKKGGGGGGGGGGKKKKKK